MIKHYDNKELRHLPERIILDTKVCPNCHKEFTYNKQITRRKKFCSYECYYSYHFQNDGYRDQRKAYYHKTHPEADGKTERTCARCNKKFRAMTTAKYCPDCLEWLAHNEPDKWKRRHYADSFNIRKDCQDRNYIEVNERKHIIAFGKEYWSVKDFCKTFGITQNQYYYRKSIGYTPEQIVLKYAKKNIELPSTGLLNIER